MTETTPTSMTDTELLDLLELQLRKNGDTLLSVSKEPRSVWFPLIQLETRSLRGALANVLGKQDGAICDLSCDLKAFHALVSTIMALPPCDRVRVWESAERFMEFSK